MHLKFLQLLLADWIFHLLSIEVVEKMEINEQNLGQLRSIFLQTLVPNNVVRKEAEKYLGTIEIQPGFSIVLLHLISLLSKSVAPEDLAIRQSASVLFKNLVKRRWIIENEDATDRVTIPDGERETIKTHVVELMCTTPPQVQKIGRAHV